MKRKIGIFLGVISLLLILLNRSIAIFMLQRSGYRYADEYDLNYGPDECRNAPVGVIVIACIILFVALLLIFSKNKSVNTQNTAGMISPGYRNPAELSTPKTNISFCPSCGSQLNVTDGKFCSKCGAKLYE